MKIRMAQLLSAVLLVAGFGLLGATRMHGAETAHAATVDVSITGAGFDPQNLTVSPGTTVTWTNNSTSAQTVTAQLPGTDPEFFNSGFIYGGQSYSRTFPNAATLTYKSLTTGNIGELTIEPGADPPPTSTPTPSGGGGGGGGGSSVSIAVAGYVPQVVEVPVGTTVTWTNNTSTVQTASAQVGGTDPNFFNSNFIYAGESWSHTFTSAGTIPYKSLTSGITGTVVIGGGGGGGGSPTNTPIPAPTNSPTEYATNTPTNPAGATATSTPLPGSTNTPTATKTATPANTPTPKPGATITPTPAKTPGGAGGSSGNDGFAPLASGWNLVSYGGPSGGATQSLAQLGGQWTVAYYWDGKQWQRYFRPGTAPSWLNNMGDVPTGAPLWILTTAPIP